MATAQRDNADRSNAQNAKRCGSSRTKLVPAQVRSCHDCKLCLWDPGLWLGRLNSMPPVVGLCANQPATPGQLRPIPCGGPCRNFQPRPRPTSVELPVPPSDDVCYIPLTQGMHAIVDAKNYEWLSRYKWTVQIAKYGRACYAVRRQNGRKIHMHREIMKTPPDMVVDHINRNGLDNREANMRNCTRLDNYQNRYWDAGQSQYRGVSPAGDKWQAMVGYHGQVYYLGLFNDEVEAARARDRKAYELAGEFAYLNFPDEIKNTHHRDTEATEPE